MSSEQNVPSSQPVFQKFNSCSGRISLLALGTLAVLNLTSCGTDDIPPEIGSTVFTPSFTEMATSAVGGAIASSDSAEVSVLAAPPYKAVQPTYPVKTSDKRVAKAVTSTGPCPDFTTVSGSGCAIPGETVGTPGPKVDLTYNNCNFGTSAPPAIWSGILEVSQTETPSGGSATPQTYTCAQSGVPAWPAASTTSGTTTALFRQFVDSNQAPSTALRIASNGLQVEIDHASAKLSNFNGEAIAPTIGAGFGTEVDFNGTGSAAQRTGVKIAERVYDPTGAGLFDYTIVGSLVITETTPGTRVITNGGSMHSYNNTNKVIANAVFSNNVTYNSQCCVPMSGTIVTTFLKGYITTVQTQGLDQKQEVLNFDTGTCGTAHFTDTIGGVSVVTLNHCF